MGDVAQHRVVHTLLDLVNDIASTSEYKKVHKKECANLARRVKLLAPLFEEVKEFRGFIPVKAAECLQALEKPLQKAKELLRLCHDGSKLYLIMEMEEVAVRFQEVTAELGQVLDGLPYDLLDVSDEVREQVELVHVQLKRAKGRIDVHDAELFLDIKTVLSPSESEEPESAVLERLADKLELKTKSAAKQELKALERMKKGEETDEKLNPMFHIMKELIAVAKIEITSSTLGPRAGVGAGTHQKRPDVGRSSPQAEGYSMADSPDDFRCPISLELMEDPVILASGQTYERACIEKWLNDGNAICPLTGVPLASSVLTPNYVLRSLICQWCETHGIQAPNRQARKQVCEDAPQIKGLLLKLKSDQPDEQRTAAEELRLLAKRSVDNRVCIAKAGAIPLLVDLLTTLDWRTQEHAVTALLNLSINDNNKGAIVLAGAINPIVEVLKSGSMEARENAAATLFSLSVVDDNKVTIGASGAIPALVDLLRDGTARGKKDAATALFNLSIFQGNKAKAVRAGVVPPLMKLLVDQTSGMVDEALAILAILATHNDGKVAIGQASAIPTLVNLIRSGSERNKENAAAILLSLSVNDVANASLACQLGVYTPLAELSQTGTPRAKRKSSQLLEHMKKMSMNSAFFGLNLQQ